MKRAVFAFLALAVGLTAQAQSGQSAQPAPSARSTETLNLGRELTQVFYQGDLTLILDVMSEEMSSAIGGEEGLSAFREQLAQQLGEEIEVLDETVNEQQGALVYIRTARFEGYGGPVTTKWAFDGDGIVVGFLVEPGQATQEAASEFLEYSTKADLRLPFEGLWTVFWGGRSVEQNYHAAYADQRFAYDFVVTEDGQTHDGDGRRNEDYYCFGLPILAPAAGLIVEVENSLADNVPGQFDDQHPLGNHVIIDHGNEEFSFLAHLRQGSVTVQPGDQVSAGSVIGECGNSGRSSEPHLHYHLQNSPGFGAGAGLPAQFRSYYADGEMVERGEPQQGQLIEAANPDN